MKRVAPMIIVLAALCVSGAQARAQNGDIFGTWMRGDKAARVVIARCGDLICATNIWIKDAAAQNENVGDKLVFNISPKDKAWSGSGQDPKRNVSFSATLKADATTMQTRGCVLGGIVCDTTNWTRE